MSTGESTPETFDVLQGVVFGRSIRAFWVVFHVAAAVQESGDGVSYQHHHVVVTVQFHNDALAKELRSWYRRTVKHGDLLRIKGGWVMDVIQEEEEESSDNDDYSAPPIPTTTKARRFVVRVWNLEQAKALVEIETVRYWDMPKCQEWQNKFLRPKKKKKSKPSALDVSAKNAREAVVSQRHGGILAKKTQSEYVANFLIHMTMYKLTNTSTESGTTILPDASEWAHARPMYSTQRAQAIQALNENAGVLDVAGGAGYVSMALGLAGVRSTVIDSRDSVGCLPKRDRKVWNRALKRRGANRTNNYDNDNNTVLLCQPVVPYVTKRAWFGAPPENVDTSIKDRQSSDQADIPIYTEADDLIQNCTAMVALHSDEATDAIVDMAVKCRIPFVVVPCCVFSRLFPSRRLPNSNEPVCTYDQLLDYLAAKDPSIQRTTLPFEGSNVALWSTFSDS